MVAFRDLPFHLSDDDVYTFLSTSLNHMIRRNDTNLSPGERGRLYAWYWGYYGRAAVDFYKLSGQERFSSLTANTIESLLEQRDDRLGLSDDERDAVVPSWGTKYKTGQRSNEITTAGLITLPMFEYAQVSGEAWIAKAAAESLFAFRPERMKTEDGEYYFCNLTQGVVEALNHAALFGAAATKASQVIQDPWLMDTALGLNRYFRRFVHHRGTSVSWPYAPSPQDTRGSLPPEAMWKAAATIELPVALSEVGLLEETKHLHEIANSLSDNPLIREGQYPQFIGDERSVAVSPDRVSGSLTSFIGSFLQINNSELRTTLLSLMHKNPSMFPNGWKGGSRAMIMAWAHMRSNGAVEIE